MLHPSTQTLINRLAEMTERGALNWEEAEDGGVIYATEGYCVAITGDTGDVVITSKDGKELERAAAAELSATPHENGDTFAIIVAAMTKEAARIARGTETAINSILAEIDDTPKPAEPVVDEADTVDETTDDTTALAADEVDYDTEDNAADDVTEAADDTEPAEAETSDDAVTATPVDVHPVETAVEADAEPSQDAPPEPTSSEDIGFIADAPTSENSDDEQLESESQMTAAVARLADEVNTPQPVAEPAAELEPETPVAAAPDAPHTYVPFGLEPEAPVAATAMPDMSATFTEPPAPTIDAETPQDASELAPAPEPEDTPPLAVEPELTAEPVATMNAPEPTPPTTSETFDYTPSFGDEAPGIEAAAPSPAEDLPAAVGDAPQAEAPAPQSYSLSGIGAGFGLGALTATTEASGVPSAEPERVEEKVVIDATDDIPFVTSEMLDEPDSETSLPDISTLEQPAPESDAAEATDESTQGEAEADEKAEAQPVLKPRTRFNPWN